MQSSKSLRVLVIGKCGREHALAWRLSQSPSVEHVFVAPGNAGTAKGFDNVSNLDELEIDQYDELVLAAKKLSIGLMVVGPDSAIVDGIEGYFRQGDIPSTKCQQYLDPVLANIPCFAPSKEAAEIEGSKSFAKDFMRRHNIPTAAYRTFDRSAYNEAADYVRSVPHRIVIKADGLAAGKGVLVPTCEEEALQALKEVLVQNKFGSFGVPVVIEEFLEGEEISVSTFSDGVTFTSLSIGQDHKRQLDGGHGPNTGGMGVYAPAPFVTTEIRHRIDREILRPTFYGLSEEGRKFCGLLFTGIMLTDCGPKVLEYNARFGDPETQSILPLLSDDVDLALVMLACTRSRLLDIDMRLSPRYACNVAIAAQGYPGKYRNGNKITLSELPAGCILFHAGTEFAGDQLITSGGRVFTVLGLRHSLGEAIAKAYEGVRSVQFAGMSYRKDIGHRFVSDPVAKTYVADD